jgi:hypothetical protein
MNDKIKDVLKLAVLIVESREGDIDTEDGYKGAVDLDTIIQLEIALCEAFDTSSDNATMAEIDSKINDL